MNVTKEIQRITELEVAHGVGGDASWHAKYKDSAYIFAGNLDYEFSEGDIIVIFSQFGEISDVNLVRDKETGKSKGFAFLKYQDQRSTILAVDNLNNATVLGRTIRVDHVDKYKQEEEEEDDDKKKKRKKKKSGADAKEWSHDMAEGLEALGNPKPAGPQDADEAWEREFAQMNAHTQELNAGDKKEKKEKKEKKKEKKEKKKEKKQEKKERKEAERDTQEEAPQPPAAPTPEPVTMAESVRRRDRSRSHDRRRDRSHSHDRRRDRSRSYDRRRHRSRSHDRRRDRSRDRRRDGRSPGRGDHRREDHRDTEREDHRKGQSSRRSDERDADNAARAHQAQLSILDDALANL